MKRSILQVIYAATFAIALTLITASQSTGALVYSISLIGSDTVQVNSPFTLDIVLTESATTPGEATLLGDPGIGVFQGNFRIGRTGAGSIDITGINGSPNFDSPIPGSSTFAIDSAQLAQQDLDAASTPTGTLVSPGTYQLVLGSISLNASAAGSNTFTMADFDLSADDLVLGDGTILDSVVTYNGLAVTAITAVPEPSSVVLLSLAGMALGAIRIRQKTWVRHVQTSSEESFEG